MSKKPIQHSPQTGRGRYLFLWTTLAIFVVIVTGGVVRLTGSACPDWPMCYGSLLPPLEPEAIFDYLHRLSTVVSVALLGFSAYEAWRSARTAALIRWPVWAALAATGLQAAVGAGLRLGSPQVSTPLHFGLAHLALGLMLSATVVAFVRHTDASQPPRLRFKSPFAKSVVLLLGLLFVTLTSGVWVAEVGFGGDCIGLLGCGDTLLPASVEGWAHLGHQFTVLVTGILALFLVVRAWRSQRSQRAILSAMTIVGVLFVAQAQLGLLKAARGYPLDLLGLHATAAAALWAAAMALTIFVGLYARSAQEEADEAALPVDWRQRGKDLLALTKPIIVVLLLVTTYGGMVIGGKALPGAALTFWTLLGGALAAGGSGAVNQYIDRNIDQRMARTAKRPIASGRVTPAEGIAYGFALLFAAFFLLAGYVNLLAALLSLAGMIYYVVLYSIYLKTATVQNIVIGGGAGAIPPLVGWAAVTGQLEIPALLLFAIIFMWTPPHFWALALVRQNEYAKAGIPMLPVVRGERETRRQVFIYTLELVALTAVMWLFDFAGGFYLVCAAILGSYLIYAAWRVWRVGGNKIAWHMYRYSSMYLALLFLAMMVDALI